MSFQSGTERGLKESILVNDDGLDSDEEKCDGDAITDLVDGISLSELKSGTTFEIKPDYRKGQDEFQTYFGNEEMLKYVKLDCLDLGSDDEEGRSGAPGDTPFERLASKMKIVTPDGSVKKRIIRKGENNGPKVPEGALITIHYNAYLEFGDEPFDSTNLRGGPQKYRLGKGNLLPGLEIAVETMRLHEISQFLIEPKLAWGALGCPPRIPPNATTLFEVELIDFIDSGGAADFDALTAEEQKNADFPVVMRAVKGLRLQGNELHKHENFHQAAKRYKKAVSILEGCKTVENEEQEEQLNKLLVKLYVNLGIVCNKLKQPAQACTFTKKALALDPNNIKALFNRGKALLLLNDYKESNRFLKAAQRLNPKNEDINVELKKLEEKHAANKMEEMEMYQKMFRKHSALVAERVEKKEKKNKEAVSDKFREIALEDLKRLKDGEEMEQITLPSGLTVAEETFIQDEAKNLGLRFMSNGGKLTIRKQ